MTKITDALNQAGIRDPANGNLLAVTNALNCVIFVAHQSFGNL